MSALPPDLRARILSAARSEPSPTRALEGRKTLVAVVAGALVSVGLSAALGGPTDERRAIIVALVGIGAAVGALSATWMAASRGNSMLGRSRATLIAVAVGVPIAFLVWSLLSCAVEGTPPVPGESIRAHVVCFVFTLFFAAGPFAALAYARRRSDPVHPRALGAALGGAAGAWGGMFIDIHCAFTSVTHLTFGHVAPIAFLAGLGALVGGRVFGLRSA